MVAGGVGANRRLRERLRGELTARGCYVYYPRSEFCTDNGAMVALAGSLRFPSRTRAVLRSSKPALAGISKNYDQP